MSANNKTSVKSIAKEAEKACANGSYREAEGLYTEALRLEPSNPKLYGNRSATRVNLKEYEEALEDAEKALQLDPNYAMGYFRQGTALQLLGDFIPSIVSFSDGVVRDQKSPQYINAMIDIALKSTIRVSLEPVITQLYKMRLEINPFIVTSVIGQELLAHGHTEDAVQVLENAVAIGTRSLKLQGSVFSALSSALWSLGDTEKAIHYMKEDLRVSRQLTDNVGECRAHGNLGAAFYSKGDYQAAKENHNRQLALAQNIQDHKAMASAFSSLGHIHTAMLDHKSAAESHKQSASIMRNAKDITGWCRELGLVATAFLALGDLDSALQWQLECLRVTTDEFETGSLEGAKEEAKARVDLASVYHKMQKFTEEISCLQKSVDISRNINDMANEAQTLASLGYITRQTGDLEKAQVTYERLLELALTSSDQSLEARACANLGVIHHQQGDYEMALKLQARNLELSVEFRDVASQGRAHGNIGNAYSAMGMYEQAIQHHLKELEISRSTDDKAAECSTHGNLAVAYQALGNGDKAFQHYRSQIAIASGIGDATNESRAYMNLANFHSSRREYRQAIETYSKYLTIAENSNWEKSSGVSKACYNIGFAYFSLREYSNAINFYEQSLKISLDYDDTVGAARAYCNLGLAWKALGDKNKALECQNLFLSLSNQLQSARGVFKALGNLGDIYVSQKQPNEAMAFYQQQLELAKQSNDTLLLAQACAALGAVHRLIGDYQKSLELHSQEVEIYQGCKDSKNEFKAHGHLGAVLTSLGEFSSASKCYENQCYIARQISEASLEAVALGNMGITSINAQEYEKAIEFFERQLLVIEASSNSNLEKGKVLCNIGDCYEALERFGNAITVFNEALQLVSNSSHSPSLERVYRGLTSTCKLLNKPKEAFEYCRLRLQACQHIQDASLIAETYGDMGYLFTVLADFTHALSCLKLQMKFAENLPHIKGDAACGLGTVCQIMKNYKSAIEYHHLDLQIASEAKNLPCQGRAHGNLGVAFEALHEHTMAVKHQEQHLFIADNLNDPLAKLTALRGIARNILRLGSNHQRASLLLQQALLLARELGIKEDEGKVNLDLGLALWVCGDLQSAEAHLVEAAEILATEFWKSGVVGNQTDISVHPNLSIELYEELIACHCALTAFYVATDQHTRALGTAERLRTLPTLVARKRMQKRAPELLTLSDCHVTAERLVQFAKQNDSAIIYYTTSGGYLLTWVITPDEGLCGFCRQGLFYKNADLDDVTNGYEGSEVKNWKNLLSHLISDLRDSLGLESPSVEVEGEAGAGSPTSVTGNGEESITDYTEQGDVKDLNSDDFHVFTRLQKSQLEMTFSKNLAVLGILGPGTQPYPAKPPIYALYDLLIGGVQDKLRKYANQPQLKNLVFIVEGELQSIPYPLLKRRSADPYLSEQFVLQTATSAGQLLHDPRFTGQSSSYEFTRAVVVGNPILNDAFDIPPSHASEEEANLVGSLLKTEPLIGKTAVKDTILNSIEHTECLHLACGVSTRQPYHIHLTSKTLDTRTPVPATELMSSSASNADSGIGKEPLAQNVDDHLDDLENEGRNLTPGELAQRSLTLAEVMTFNMSAAKLVVLGSAHLQDSEQSDLGDCLMQKNPKDKLLRLNVLTQTFLAGGANSVIIPLWPVPETACKLFTQTFYSCLLTGGRACEALKSAMDALRSSEQFEHPSFWAGFVLIGQDVTLDPDDLALNHALALLIRAAPSRVHDTIRLVLHLTDKSLERMDANVNMTVPMYTAQASISKKVQNVSGWRELFSAAGFELRQSSDGLPDAVFFPRAEKREKLEALKPELISLLQVTVPVLTGLSQFFAEPRTASNLIAALETCLEEHRNCNRLNDGFDNVEQLVLITSQKTWRANGCSEILKELGFNVSQIGEENVMLHCMPEALPTIEIVLKLMKMLFGKGLNEPRAETPIEFDLQSENSKTESCQTPVGSQISNFVTRGLPPSSRRSIAVDFNSSFQSQGSLGSLNRLELPEHMSYLSPSIHHSGVGGSQGSLLPPSDSVTTLHAGSEASTIIGEPAKFSVVPSSDSIVTPKPIFPSISTLKMKGIPETLEIRRQSDDGARGTEGGARLNVESKLPKSPQRSPMFYRKQAEGQDRKSQGQGRVQGHSSNDVSSTHGHVHPGPGASGNTLPITPTGHGRFLPTAPRSKSHAMPPGATTRHATSSPYVPAPSVARSLSLGLNTGEYSSIVDKLKRLSIGDLTDEPLMGSGVTGHGGKRKDGNNNLTQPPGHMPPGATWHGVGLQMPPTNATWHRSPTETSQPQGGTLDRVQAADWHRRSVDSASMGQPKPSLGQYDGLNLGFKSGHRSSHDGALHINLPTSVTLYQPQDGAHVHSFSEVVAKRQSPHGGAHKHTLSQDGTRPPPYKHPDIVTSPRRSSGDPTHSRADSYASQGSASSARSTPRKDGKQQRRHKGAPKISKTSANPQESYSSSETSQVSYQLETSNQGKSWLISENTETPEPYPAESTSSPHQYSSQQIPTLKSPLATPPRATHSSPRPTFYQNQHSRMAPTNDQLKTVTTPPTTIFYQQATRPDHPGNHIHQKSWPAVAYPNHPGAGISGSLESLGSKPPIPQLVKVQPAIMRIRDVSNESAVFYQKSDKNRQISPHLMANFLDSPSMTPPLLSPKPVKPNTQSTSGTPSSPERPNFQHIHFKPLHPPTPTELQPGGLGPWGKQPLTYGLQNVQEASPGKKSGGEEEEEIAFV